MWKQVNRHFKAGAISGIILPAIVSVLLLVGAPEWRSPSIMLVTVSLCLAAGTLAGAIFRGIEKLISRRIPIILSILLALAASLFITAIFTSAQ